MQSLLGKMKGTQHDDMSQVVVDPTHVMPPSALWGIPFRANEHYFTVRLKTVGLGTKAGWFTKKLPLVNSCCEFLYGTTTTSVPFVVGPALLSWGGTAAPRHVDFEDTRLCDIHPYRGGELTVAVALSSVAVDPTVKRLFEFLEKAAGTLGATAAVGPYAALGQLVAGTINNLVTANQATPLFGARMALSADNGTLRSGHIVVAAEDLTPEETWLIDSRVKVGRSREDAVDLAAEHVVVTIELSSDRSDGDALPLVREFWPRVEDLAGRPDKGSWTTAKTWLSVLAQELYLSPDLIRGQAEGLYRRCVEDAVERHREAQELAHLGPADEESSDLQVLRNIDDAIRAL
jgi:hypothetical protein